MCACLLVLALSWNHFPSRFHFVTIIHPSGLFPQPSLYIVDTTRRRLAKFPMCLGLNRRQKFTLLPLPVLSQPALVQRECNCCPLIEFAWVHFGCLRVRASGAIAIFLLLPCLASSRRRDLALSLEMSRTE